MTTLIHYYKILIKKFKINLKKMISTIKIKLLKIKLINTIKIRMQPKKKKNATTKRKKKSIH